MPKWERILTLNGFGPLYISCDGKVTYCSRKISPWDNKITNEEFDRSIFVRDIHNTEKIIQSTRINAGTFCPVTFSKDGTKLINTNEVTLEIWSLEKGLLEDVFIDDGECILINRAIFGYGRIDLASCSVFAASDAGDTSIRVWKDARKTPYRIFSETGEIGLYLIDYQDVDLSRDETILAAAVNGIENSFMIWDIETGQLMGKILSDRRYKTKVRICPNSRYLAGGCSDGFVLVHDLLTETQSLSKCHQEDISALEFCDDGQILATGGGGYFNRIYKDNSIKLWYVPTLEEYCCLNGHSDSIEYLKFSSDRHYLVSASSNGETIVWEDKEWPLSNNFLVN